VPAATRALTHRFDYNDLESLDRLFRDRRDEIAAVILEPMNVADPKPGFLEGVAETARRHGAVLIFDETITGFRFANGGAQELFGVTPDLATLGKGLANGYPLSAVVGRADIMAEMEEVFFSFTMGGEALSLAAASAALRKVKQEPVVEQLLRTGISILAGTRERITRHGVGSFLNASGHPSWTFLQFSDSNGCSMWEIKTLFMQEVLARGVLTLGTHNVSYAHSEGDVARLMTVYDEVFPILREAVVDGAMKQYLRCKPLEPLFRVR
jgi:glutamate-1-semialdehyde 2,1-aminomutase